MLEFIKERRADLHALASRLYTKGLTTGNIKDRFDYLFGGNTPNPNRKIKEIYYSLKKKLVFSQKVL